MKTTHLRTFSLLLILCFSGSGLLAQKENPLLDKNLADSLGGDDYGMKAYVLVILKTGSAKTENKTRVDSLFKLHLENIGKLAEAGKLVVAGPLKKNDKAYRGIFILNVVTLQEAKLLLESDAAIREKLLDAELYNWYGSAALPMYLNVHSKIERKKM